MLKFLTAIVLAMVAFDSAADITLTQDLLKQEDEGIPGSSAWHGEITLNKDVVTNASMYVTSKGNGGLEILNLSLKVYDAHDDEGLYQDHMLLIEFTDLNEDGYLDLMITGIYLITPEKGDGVLEESVVVFMCHFDPKTNQFKKRYQRMPEVLEGFFNVN